jgi:branched-chain amino acid transport system permease protein
VGVDPAGFRTKILPSVVLLGLILVPIFGSIYFVHVMTLALIYSVFAIGLQVLTGYAGQLSLGHAAFFGVGAYTSALLAVDLRLPFWATAPLATATAALLGACLAPITRLHGHYLAVATLGFGEIVYLVLVNWVHITRGPFGLLNIPAPVLGSIVFDTAHQYFYLALATAAAAYILVARLVSDGSRFGRGLSAIRQNEMAAVAVGVSGLWYKLQAFIVSAALAGLAGSLFAHFDGYLNPSEFRLDTSILVLLMIVVGGLARVEGAVLGAFLLVFAAEYLRFLKEYRMLVYGIGLIVLMLFLPGGLAQALAACRAASRALWDTKASRPKGKLGA